MKQKKNTRIKTLILVLSGLFLLMAGTGLYFTGSYIAGKLLQASENTAMDIALLIKNNFSITDEEVSYMKGLTFNEMETDPINLRLMEVGKGTMLNASICNIYLLAPLSDEEIKYTVYGKEAEFFGYTSGTPLNGVWLLNGKINENGEFEPVRRADIYRYTALEPSQKQGMTDKRAFGEYSADAWGNFITGYVPVETVEGNFAGLLGIDMNPDKYQASAQSMISAMILAFAAVTVTLVGMFLLFYYKYTRAKEGQVAFEFYSRMSHDMRTPMNGILGMAALSKDETDVDVLHHNFEVIEDSGKYMLELINDTLDLQRLDARKLTLHPQPLHAQAFADSLIQMVGPSIQQKGIDLQVINKGMDLDVYIYADSVRIKQVFMNLMSNAIKFTPRGGKICFCMECLGMERNVSHNKFEIRDTGVGIREDFLKNKLFKPFEQENNPMTSQDAGSGLGLTITKKIVDLLNGTIEVESKPGNGTVFRISLDFVLISKKAALQKMKQNQFHGMDAISFLKGKRILLCEDHPINSEIAIRLLDKHQIQVEHALNGQLGLELFERSEEGYYDAVLMDIHMPVMDGITAAVKIRRIKHPDGRRIPIIAMTANAYAEDIKKSLEAGMNAHLAKPIEPQQLYETLAEAICRYQEHS